MNRRSFFSLLANAPVVTAAGVAIPPAPARGVEFLSPMCPSCCCLFDMFAVLPNLSTAARVEAGLTPTPTTCQYCAWTGSVTFYRRQ